MRRLSKGGSIVTIGQSGVLADGRLRWLRALLWMALLAAAIVMAFNLTAAAGLWIATTASGEPFTTRAAAPDAAKLAGAVTGSVAILLLYWGAVRAAERRAVDELGIRSLAPDLLLGLAVGAALIAAIVGALWLFGWVAIDRRPVDGIALALRDSIRSGVVEELLLRLVIFRLTWRAFGVWPALAIAALLFGALHLANPDSSPFAAIALACGEGIGIGLYLITGRIWASIGMHAAWNFTQGWIFGAAVSGTSGIAGGPLTSTPMPGVPELLSGGAFGPEASLAGLIISATGSAIVLGWAWKIDRFAAAGEAQSEPQPK